MIRLSYRLTLVCCSLLGAMFGCGQDETVYPKSLVTADGGQTTPTPTVTSTTPTTNTPPTPTSPSGSTTLLGAACTSDATCGQGLKCLTSTGNDWLGGGVAHGYCTADCAADGNTLCNALTPGAQCLQTTTGDYCMLGCTPGTANNPKCQSREDVACDLVTLSNSTGGAFCRPMCRGDEDCNGRKCLLGSGVCVDELVGEDPLGVACDPAAEENTCVSSHCAAGITDGTQAVGYCSGLCMFGVGGCGSTSVMPEKAGDPSCFPAFSGGGRGDMGLCIQTCDCDADCDADKFVCAQIPGAFEALGVQGFCFEFDLAIASDSDVVLGVECASRDGGGDAMSHADTGVFDASAFDAALEEDAASPTTDGQTDAPAAGSDGAAPPAPAIDAAPDAQ